MSMSGALHCLSKTSEPTPTGAGSENLPWVVHYQVRSLYINQEN